MKIIKTYAKIRVPKILKGGFLLFILRYTGTCTGVLIIKPPLKSKILKAEGNFDRNFENKKNLDKKSYFGKMKIIKARRRRFFRIIKS